MANQIKYAKLLVAKRQYGEALYLLTELPQLGFAFSSKVCAFISGSTCGVIDSVIVDKYPDYGFEIDRNGYVKRSQHNALCYQEYCNLPQEKAMVMNRLGVCFYVA